jgi:hypothetical protein
VTRRDSSAALRGGPCKIDWRVERIGVSGNAGPWASLALDLSRRAHLAITNAEPARAGLFAGTHAPYQLPHHIRVFGSARIRLKKLCT